LLPIITIGLTELAKPVAENIADGRGVWHFANHEDALWTLQDAADRQAHEHVEPSDLAHGAVAALDDDGETWFCHVIYGEHILGEMITRQPEMLPIKGYRLVIIDSLPDDQGAPRRVRDGRPAELSVKSELFSAIPRMGARAVASATQVDAIAIAALSGLLSQSEADLIEISAKEG
jgi:hypothetical protein